MQKNNVLLEVKNLVKEFVTKKLFKKPSVFTAVDSISFNVNEGEILGLLGPNGAGKTTTIQMLLSVMTPTSGTIQYFGKDLSTHRSEILEKVAFASTYVKLPGRLTVYENLDIHARMYNIPSGERVERIKKYLQLFDMWNLKDREAGFLSAGQITRAMLAKAFLTEPAIVLLDEPTASLDPDIAYDVREFVRQQQKERGVSILFTSHNMDEVAEVCNRVLVLKNGKIIADNTPDQLASSVSISRINLVLTGGLEKLENYLKEKQLKFVLEKNHIKIEIDEHAIAQFLSDIAQLDIKYSSINIENPTLEDYFLHISKSNHQEQV